MWQAVSSGIEGSTPRVMSDRLANGSGNTEAPLADIDAATKRLMAALDALESSVERRREADRDENELASRIQRSAPIAHDLPTNSTVRW